MAVRPQHAGDQLHHCMQSMRHVLEFGTIGSRGLQRLLNLPEMPGVRGIDLTRRVIDDVIRDLQWFLQFFQTGDADGAVLDLNIIDVDAFRGLHQLRQRLGRDVLQCGDRGTHRADVLTHIRHMDGDRPQRRRRLAVRVVHVLGEFGHLVAHLRSIVLRDGALQTPRGLDRPLQFALRVPRRPCERADERGDHQQYNEHAYENALVTAPSFDSANMLGAHAPANATRPVLLIIPFIRFRLVQRLRFVQSIRHALP